VIKVIKTCDICKENDEKNNIVVYDVSPSVTAIFKLIHSNYNIHQLCEKCWINKYSKLSSNKTITESNNILLMLPKNAFEKLEDIIR